MRKMKVLTTPYFLSFAAIYIIYQLVLLNNIPVHTFFSSYLNDIVCMPLVFSFLLLAVRRFKNDYKMVIPVQALLFVTVYWCVYFEWYLPSTSDRYTADSWDVIIYCLGAASFYFFQLSLAMKAGALKYDLLGKQ